MTTYDTLQVDIGNAPNDDQGDPLRTAFYKINQRFAELRVFLNNRGDWAPNTAYTANPNRDWVIVGGVGYLATSNHTSGATFAADLAAGKWVEADAIQLRADLASAAPGNGAEMVAYASGETVASALGLLRISSVQTVTVPGDYPDLQAALDWCSMNRPKNGGRITVLIQSGHLLTKGFRLDGVDLSFVTISSEDATVGVSTGFQFVSNTDLGEGVPRTSLIGFLAVRAKMPTWNVLVNMTGVSCVTGYELNYGSDGLVMPGKGVINTSWADGANGVNCRVVGSSRLNAGLAVFTGAKANNVGVSLASFANLQDANLNTSTTEACLDVSRGSVVHALGVNVSGSEYAGIYARRSFVSAQGANFSGSNRGVWASAGSFVGCPDSVFDGCSFDVVCDGGSYVGLGRSTKNGASLAPSQSVVQGATSGTGALRDFNISGGYGLITYANSLPGTAEYLSAGSGTTVVASASLQNIASLTYATALNLTGKRIVRGGVIYGTDVGVRITIDGVVVLTDVARALGQDGAANNIAMVAIPPCKCEQSILIEAYNRSSTPGNLGWRFYHSPSL